MNAVLDSTHAGARALKTVINRDEILQAIKQAADDETGGVHVFYITGLGGMGKTFLLREVLRRFQLGGQWASPNVLAANTEVDFYHSETHSVEGLTAALYNTLQAGGDYFKQYLIQRQEFQRSKSDLREALSDLDRRRDSLANEFIQSLEALAASKRLVFAFDTAEKLQYESDRIQQLLNIEDEGIGIRAWLIKTVLPRLRNAVVLIAGRPHPERLRQDLREALGARLQEYELGDFHEQETLDYFEAVAQQPITGIAERLAAVSEDTRRVIHLYTGGRPILLALTIDYLVAANHLLPEVLVSLEEAREKSPKELDKIRHKLEADIVHRLQDLDRPSDRVIRNLAWTRKGMDAELLSLVSGMSLEESQVGLEGVKGMSFVKTRPGDNRVFLHDEMYDMLQRYVLDRLPEPRAEQAYRAIEGYYDRQIKVAREEVERLEREVRGQITFERQAVWTPQPSGLAPEQLAIALEQRAAAQLHLENLLVEDVHYRLYHRPANGFEAYRICGPDDAFDVGTLDFGLKLRDELLSFVNDPTRKDLERIDGLRRDDVELDAGLYWIKRDLVRGRCAPARDLVRLIRKECADLLTQGGPSTAAELNILEGWALTYTVQDLGYAEALLRGAIKALAGDRYPRAKALVARAHNLLGFLLRSRGYFRQAIKEYLDAIRLWRELGPRFKDGLANTLNNVAWARAEIGGFDQALKDCRDGLNLRQALGPRYPVALSFNTMGMIQTRADKAHEGRVNCEHALVLFRELRMPRGVGLAEIAIAEATRRMGTGDPELYYPEQVIDLLRQARGFAADAVSIFEQEMLEPARLVEALRELGCIFRDWAWLRPQDPRPEDNDLKGPTYNPSRTALTKLGEEPLTRAAQLAREIQLPHLEIDVLVNLAWLYYYVEDIPAAQQVLAQAKKVTSPEYHFTAKKPLSKPKEAVGWFWVQLGKAHVLEGNIAMHEFLKEKKPASLRLAGRHYTLALAYDDLYGRDFRDRRRAEEHIHRQLKGLNIKELSILGKAVGKTAATYHLKHPVSMLDFMQQSFGL